MIAALFVQKDGAYFGLPDVDPWDETRDARKYDGPHAVVAHPPCQLWVNFAALNFKRYGGEHNRPGNDGGCFASALASVRRWGGCWSIPQDLELGDASVLRSRRVVRGGRGAFSIHESTCARFGKALAGIVLASGLGFSTLAMLCLFRFRGRVFQVRRK